MYSTRLRLPCRTKEDGKAIAISKTISNWAAEPEYRAPPQLYLECREVCQALGAVPGVSVVPRAAKWILAPIGRNSASLPSRGSSPKATTTRPRHIEPEHLSPNLVWAHGCTLTIHHTNFYPVFGFNILGREE